jgi:hypothetical protein
VDDVGARMALTVDSAGVRGECDALADGMDASRPGASRTAGADVLFDATFAGLCTFAWTGSTRRRLPREALAASVLM